MTIRFFLFLIITSLTVSANAQKMVVPDSILSELQIVKLPADSLSKDSLLFKVVYPVNYDSKKSYPVFFGLSGGDQRESIVNYCYAAWFRSSFFSNHITILPVNYTGKNLMRYSKSEINSMLATIKTNFNVTADNWIIAGTSNGGRASFNFIAAEPKLFQGGIVIPGVMKKELGINDQWKDLKFVLAYGDKDDKGYKKGAKKTKKALSKYVKSAETLKLKGQGHILPIDFDIDFVYRKYFESCN